MTQPTRGSEPTGPEPTGPRPRKTIIWIIGGILVVLLALFALQGTIRGGGEAAGIDEAAPGGADADPQPAPSPGQAG